MAYPASLKMSCSQLVLDRLDPLVQPGVTGTSHLHQIVGGNAFNATMDPAGGPAERSTCTTCTFTDDFSNYWTAAMYFQARNGSYKRVKQLGALFHEEARGGGMTIYYFPQFIEPEKVKIRAFASGFRMQIGHPDLTTPAVPPLATEAGEPSPLHGITYTCLLRDDTRFTNLSFAFPAGPCPEGILTTLSFPPCWDGRSLDSADHRSHVAYPAAGADYHQGATCPPSHPVNIPQVALEIRWDTRPFNDPDLWPVEEGRQPFVWSFGDRVGYGHHADYLFGWRGDALSRTFDRDCSSNDQLCNLPVQTISEANECALQREVEEEVDGWMDTMPGGVVARDWVASG
ncbi:uncharacterized protein B0H64DRAFT_356211 [Chaetomium fimeti]|uniref:DUF1996 domain-containing protein n=1 Tax=Chaetomium fimeti TaxID=1854472 RepID=A0AAE0HI91_9PEZI|nr:hypothetical protein B0H64DRAFT_356211 [Chaetomium fimeti]